MAWGAAIAAIGSALIGGASNYFSNKSSYEDSLEAQREANAFNEQEAVKNRDFLSAEAEKDRQFQWRSELNTREYNSAGQQMNRLRAAGINPYLADGLNAGEGSSVAGSNVAGGSQASSAPPPHRSPIDYGSVINGGVNSYVAIKQAENQQKLMDAQAEMYNQQGIGYALQNNYAHTKAIMDLQESAARAEATMQEGKQKDAVRRMYEWEIRKFEDTYDDQVKGVELRNDLVVAQTAAQNAAAALSKHGIKLQEAQISQLAAEVQRSVADIKKAMAEIDVMAVSKDEKIQAIENMKQQHANMISDGLLTKSKNVTEVEQQRLIRAQVKKVLNDATERTLFNMRSKGFRDVIDTGDDLKTVRW